MSRSSARFFAVRRGFAAESAFETGDAPNRVRPNACSRAWDHANEVVSPVFEADSGEASLSADNRDPASWRWGGPGWEERAVAGRVRAVSIGADPDRWSSLLDRPVRNGTMVLDDGSELRFVDGEGVVAIELEVGGETVILPRV